MDNKIFTSGNTKTTLLRFAIPAIISLLVVELYNMVDTVFVGRYVGTEAIAALTLAFPVQRLLSALALLVGVGATTLVAKHLGEKNIGELKVTIKNSILLTSIILLITIGFLYIFKDRIIYFLGASTDTFDYADKYISIIILGGLFQGLSITMCSIMTALGDTKITLYSNSLGAIINIFIDLLLVAVLSFGIEGAAIATTLSQAIAFFYTLNKFLKVKKYYSLNGIKVKSSVSIGIIGTIITIGFSTFVIEISDAVVSIILNNLLLSRGGDAAIVMVGVITKISMFMFIAIIGISSAMQPIVAYNYGAGNYDEMKKTLKLALKVVSFISVIFWAILVIFSNNIIGFFLEDKALLAETVRAFRISISILPVVGIYYIAIYFYQSIGDARSSFLLSVYRQLVVFIPVVLIMVNYLGVNGAWLSYPISDGISAVTSIFFLYRLWRLDFSEEAETKGLQKA
ncbi:MAG: MATE family efflux transporter [Clostridiaceae bacterium]